MIKKGGPKNGKIRKINFYHKYNGRNKQND